METNMVYDRTHSLLLVTSRIKHRSYYVATVLNPTEALRAMRFPVMLGSTNIARYDWLIRKTMCGTLDYLPPEMVVGDPYSEHVDHWCLGILCYEFHVDHLPFESKESSTTYLKIKRVDVKFPSFVMPGPRDLISKLLQRVPTNRLPLPGGSVRIIHMLQIWGTKRKLF